MFQDCSSPRRVLVLGGGFIGSAVARALLVRGHSVVVLTRSQPSPQRTVLMHGAELVIASPNESDQVLPLLSEVDDVLYAVGSSNPARSEMAPAAEVVENVPPLVWLLELVRQHPHARLLFLSSGGTVYGNALQVPTPENSPLRPISSYGIAKSTCESFLSMYSEVHGISTHSLRVSNPYGPGQPGLTQGVVARMLHCARTGESLTLFGYGKAVRDFIYIDDLATVITSLVETADLPLTLNVGSGIGTSTSEVVELVREITGRSLAVHMQPSRTSDVNAAVLDVTRLTSLVTLPGRSLREGITMTWQAVE